MTRTDHVVIQKRPSEKPTVIHWRAPYGMDRTYPNGDCPNDPTSPRPGGQTVRTHDVDLLLNRFTNTELLYCYVCEEWFPLAEGYRG